MVLFHPDKFVESFPGETRLLAAGGEEDACEECGGRR